MKNPNIKAYQKMASKWKEVRDSLSMPNCVIDFAKEIPSGGQILDVGCGTGYPIASWFANHGYHVTGIDFVSNMIEYANQLNLNNAEFILSDLINFHPNKKFDGIVAFDVLFHLSIEQQLPALTHLASLLKPNGSILFTHGKKMGEITGKMFDETFYYSSLKTSDYVKHAKSLGLSVTTLIEDYKEPTVGERDLLMVLTLIK
jgi:2-polyprenyl-3-methyl-5-hydroxy-6-metoxy-1,4-benzoquinol methylase